MLGLPGLLAEDGRTDFTVPLIIVVIVMLVGIVFLAVFFRYFSLWIQCKSTGAGITLLDLITMASAAFAGWVKQLREGTLQGEIDGGKIVELARKLKSGEITEPPAAAAAPAAEAEDVEIGGVRMTRSFFIGHLSAADLGRAS